MTEVNLFNVLDLLLVFWVYFHDFPIQGKEATSKNIHKLLGNIWAFDFFFVFGTIFWRTSCHSEENELKQLLAPISLTFNVNKIFC